jgi:hypothetical protein
MIGPCGLLLVIPHPFAVPVSVLWVGLQKEYVTKLGCEKYLPEAHILSTTGDALRCLSNTIYRKFPQMLFAESDSAMKERHKKTH